MSDTTVRPHRRASLPVTAHVSAGRALREFVRTPQLIGTTLGQGVLFLLVFRYVFGGAIETGGQSYIDYLAPGIITAGLLFAATAAAVAVAQDRAVGLTDLFAGLPASRVGLAMGRLLADTVAVLLAAGVMIIVAVAVGFRPTATGWSLFASVTLLVVYAAVFAALFGALGAVADGPQAAQGLGFVAIPLTFVSSAYVPTESMPWWLAWVADNQPVTVMIEALRDQIHATGGGSLAAAIGISLVLLTLAVAASTRVFTVGERDS